MFAEACQQLVVFQQRQVRGFDRQLVHDVHEAQRRTGELGKSNGFLESAYRRPATVHRNQDSLVHDVSQPLSGASRMSNSGTDDFRNTVSASLPSARRRMPRRPCVPITIRSAGHASASCTMDVAACPPMLSISLPSHVTPTLSPAAVASSRII